LAVFDNSLALCSAKTLTFSVFSPALMPLLSLIDVRDADRPVVRPANPIPAGNER
jgi:hypothetical protein